MFAMLKAPVDAVVVPKILKLVIEPPTPVKELGAVVFHISISFGAVPAVMAFVVATPMVITSMPAPVLVKAVVVGVIVKEAAPEPDTVTLASAVAVVNPDANKAAAPVLVKDVTLVETPDRVILPVPPTEIPVKLVVPVPKVTVFVPELVIATVLSSEFVSTNVKAVLPVEVRFNAAVVLGTAKLFVRLTVEVLAFATDRLAKALSVMVYVPFALKPSSVTEVIVPAAVALEPFTSVTVTVPSNIPPVNVPAVVTKLGAVAPFVEVPVGII
jgi:hypothetical protein